MYGVRVGAQRLNDDAQQNEACHELAGAKDAGGAHKPDLVGAEGDDVGPDGHETDGKPRPSGAVHLTAYGTASGKAGGTKKIEYLTLYMNE